MITNEVYMEIEVLRKHGFSLRRIASEVGCSVNTVRSHLSAGQQPRYERQKKRSAKLLPYEPYLRERQAAAHPLWIPATVLQREIAGLGYPGGMSQLRRFLRGIKPTLPEDPVVRFETPPGEQLQVDWVEFRKGIHPLYAFCATLGYSRASYVEFVIDMKVGTLIDCHQKAFAAMGGVPRRILYDNMKTVVLERDVDGPGEHRYHAGFLDYARHADSSSSCAVPIGRVPKARWNASMVTCVAPSMYRWSPRLGRPACSSTSSPQTPRSDTG